MEHPFERLLPDSDTNSLILNLSPKSLSRGCERNDKKNSSYLYSCVKERNLLSSEPFGPGTRESGE